MMANVIRRGTTRMLVEFLDLAYISKYGQFTTLERLGNEADFVGRDLQGNSYRFMQGIIRNNPNIRVVECYKN